MVGFMFARFPQPPVAPDAEREGQCGLHPLDWHALIARLEAERDLRGSLAEHFDGSGFASLLAEGSFDPRAAEMLFTLAASTGMAGDRPLGMQADHATGLRSGAHAPARLRNAKPSDCNNRAHETGRTPQQGRSEQVAKGARDEKHG